LEDSRSDENNNDELDLERSDPNLSGMKRNNPIYFVILPAGSGLVTA